MGIEVGVVIIAVLVCGLLIYRAKNKNRPSSGGSGGGVDDGSIKKTFLK